MFNLTNLASDLFTRGASAVLEEARDAVKWGEKILAKLAKIALKITGKMVNNLRAAIAILKKQIPIIDKILKGIKKGVMPSMSVLKKAAEALTGAMGKVWNLADRLAAFVEGKAIALLTSAQALLIKNASMLTGLAKKALKGIIALRTHLTKALQTDALIDKAKDIGEAIVALNIVEKAMLLMQKCKAAGNNALSVIDPDDMIKNGAKVVGRVFDKMTDPLQKIAKSQLEKALAMLSKVFSVISRMPLVATDPAKAAVASLLVTFKRVNAELAAASAEVFRASVEEQLRRNEVMMQFKAVRARADKARDENKSRLDALKRMLP
ncbi:MAG: hypothetical protein AAF631_05735 [Pseudomonadota bacterium]